MPRPPSLPTLLSPALVAYKIELDNEAEHLLPHQTSARHGEHRLRGQRTLAGVLLVVGANVLQHVDDDGIAVADLRSRARTDQLLLGGLRRCR